MTTDPERKILTLLENNAEISNDSDYREEFSYIADKIVRLWAKNREEGTTWTPEFQEQAPELIRKQGNSAGFRYLLSECETYALRSRRDGFYHSCDLRSRIQVIMENFVPFKEFVHPDDIETLEDIEETYLNYADDIPPIPHDKIPSWVPESHSWWRIPTRHDMSKEEIEERLYEIYPEDWDPNY
ncbi:hypothetical protein [Nocardiopsis alba]|uniref:hypothetical protein n=1 Tax=Nocardiopsis alba TaxID=53437 RepID=UPI0033A6860B